MGEGSNDTGQKIRDALVSLLAPDMGTNAIANVDAFVDRIFTFTVERQHDSNTYLSANPNLQTPNTNAAALASTHTLFASTGVVLRVDSVKAVVSSNVTLANTNYATFALVYNDGAGGADTTIASNTTEASGATNSIAALTAGVPANVTINASNASIPVAKCVQLKVTKAAAGFALPQMTFVVKMKPSK